MEGDEYVPYVTDAIYVLSSLRDFIITFVGFENSWLPQLVGINILATVQGTDRPWTYLADFVEIDVPSGPQTVANLLSNSCLNAVSQVPTCKTQELGRKYTCSHVVPHLGYVTMKTSSGRALRLRPAVMLSGVCILVSLSRRRSTAFRDFFFRLRNRSEMPTTAAAEINPLATQSCMRSLICLSFVPPRRQLRYFLHRVSSSFLL